MAKEEQYGELIPKGGGDPIPLLKKKLLIGRRESCDIVLRFGNISAHHCEMTLESGYWFVKDMNSRNGTRVNGYRVTKRRLDPRDVLSVAKYQYEMNYVPADLGAVGPPPDGGELEDILDRTAEHPGDPESEGKRRYVLPLLQGDDRLPRTSCPVCKFLLRHLSMLEPLAPHAVYYLSFRHCRPSRLPEEV